MAPVLKGILLSYCLGLGLRVQGLGFRLSWHGMAWHGMTWYVRTYLFTGVCLLAGLLEMDVQV